MTATVCQPASANPMPQPVEVLGLPVTPFTMQDTIACVNQLITERRPSYFITANLNYAMISQHDASLRDVNDRAAFVLADGMPLVWASRFTKSPLPERVAGSDLLFELAAESATKGYRVFFIGGRDGVAAKAAENLRQRYPGLNVCGIEVPPFRSLTEHEEDDMIQRIRAAQPDLLIGAFSQPFGEKWLAANVKRLGVPVCVQLGASLDFAAGQVYRAPRWIAAIGMEWAFRIAVEPRRLAGRYLNNALFLARHMLLGSRHHSHS